MTQTPNSALPAKAASTRPVINATGVVLHTNLGRAPLSHAAVEALVDAAGATDVEFDLVTGARARRGRGAVAALAAAVPAAEAVHVVNNGAAALVLTATALAAGREIIVSRGEMVEIGDGFRLPDLLVSTGARLREVGTRARKGIEALIDEMVLAARAYGLDEAVLASASKTLTRPFMDTVHSLTPSGVIHAKRRTEEVDMAAEAVADAGIEPLMARATAERLRWKESLGLKDHFKGVVPENYKIAIDAIVEKMQATKKAAE